MATALLAVGMTGAAVATYIYPSIERLISGEISYRSLNGLIMGLFMIIFSGTVAQLAWRTWRYSKEFVKTQPDSPSTQSS